MDSEIFQDKEIAPFLLYSLDTVNHSLLRERCRDEDLGHFTLGCCNSSNKQKQGVYVTKWSLHYNIYSLVNLIILSLLFLFFFF